MDGRHSLGLRSAIQLVDDTTEMMLVFQFGKVIRIGTETVRSDLCLAKIMICRAISQIEV
jgi:hypothetical protein